MADDFAAFEALMNTYGQEQTQQTPAPDVPSTESAEATPPPTENTTVETQQAQNQEPANNQAAAAFAKMRAENSRLTKLIEHLGGSQYDANASLEENLTKLEQAAQANKAKELNINPELLSRLEQQEAYIAQLRSRETQQNLASTFGQIMSEHSLTATQVYEFAQELSNAHIDALALGPDKVAALYKGLHFDDLVRSKVDTAVASALTRDQSASQHSTSPGQTQGAPSTNTGEKISSLKEFEEALNGYNT